MAGVQHKVLGVYLQDCSHNVADGRAGSAGSGTQFAEWTILALLTPTHEMDTCYSSLTVLEHFSSQSCQLTSFSSVDQTFPSLSVCMVCIVWFEHISESVEKQQKLYGRGREKQWKLCGRGNSGSCVGKQRKLCMMFLPSI